MTQQCLALPFVTVCVHNCDTCSHVTHVCVILVRALIGCSCVFGLRSAAVAAARATRTARRIAARAARRSAARATRRRSAARARPRHAQCRTRTSPPQQSWLLWQLPPTLSTSAAKHPSAAHPAYLEPHPCMCMCNAILPQRLAVRPPFSCSRWRLLQNKSCSIFSTLFVCPQVQDKSSASTTPSCCVIGGEC